GSFFAEGSESGLIGGLAQAFVLSLLNVGGAVAYGIYGARLLCHRQWSVRVLGITTTLAYAMFALALNLTVAHFPDLYVMNAGQVRADDVLQRLANGPIRFRDVQSWILGIFGVGLSLGVLIDAFGLDDPYPGFGDVGRRRQ